MPATRFDSVGARIAQCDIELDIDNTKPLKQADAAVHTDQTRSTGASVLIGRTTFGRALGLTSLFDPSRLSSQSVAWLALDVCDSSQPLLTIGC